MLTGMTRKEVEKAKVFVTIDGLTRMDACFEAKIEWGETYGTKPVKVGIKSVRAMLEYDIGGWLGIVYDTVSSRLGPMPLNFYTHMDDDIGKIERRYGTDAGENMSSRDISTCALFVKAAVIAYLRNVERRGPDNG